MGMFDQIRLDKSMIPLYLSEEVERDLMSGDFQTKDLEDLLTTFTIFPDKLIERHWDFKTKIITEIDRTSDLCEEGKDINFYSSFGLNNNWWEFRATWTNGRFHIRQLSPEPIAWCFGVYIEHMG
jgi:hypothetical protein